MRFFISLNDFILFSFLAALLQKESNFFSKGLDIRVLGFIDSLYKRSSLIIFSFNEIGYLIFYFLLKTGIL